MIEIEDLATGYYVATQESRSKKNKMEDYKVIVFFSEAKKAVYKVGESCIYSAKNFEFHYGPLMSSDGELAIKNIESEG